MSAVSARRRDNAARQPRPKNGGSVVIPRLRSHQERFQEREWDHAEVAYARAKPHKHEVKE